MRYALLSAHNPPNFYTLNVDGSVTLVNPSSAAGVPRNDKHVQLDKKTLQIAVPCSVTQFFELFRMFLVTSQTV